MLTTTKRTNNEKFDAIIQILTSIPCRAKSRLISPTSSTKRKNSRSPKKNYIPSINSTEDWFKKRMKNYSSVSSYSETSIDIKADCRESPLTLPTLDHSTYSPPSKIRSNQKSDICNKYKRCKTPPSPIFKDKPVKQSLQKPLSQKSENCNLVEQPQNTSKKIQYLKFTVDMKNNITNKDSKEEKQDKISANLMNLNTSILPPSTRSLVTPDKDIESPPLKIMNITQSKVQEKYVLNFIMNNNIENRTFSFTL